MNGTPSQQTSVKKKTEKKNKNKTEIKQKRITQRSTLGKRRETVEYIKKKNVHGPCASSSAQPESGSRCGSVRVSAIKYNINETKNEKQKKISSKI